VKDRSVRYGNEVLLSVVLSLALGQIAVGQEGQRRPEGQPERGFTEEDLKGKAWTPPPEQRDKSDASRTVLRPLAVHETFAGIILIAVVPASSLRAQAADATWVAVVIAIAVVVASILVFVAYLAEKKRTEEFKQGSSRSPVILALNSLQEAMRRSLKT
jgi:hypothetical protein